MIANASLDCTDGKDYSVCRPVFADEESLTEQILSLALPLIEKQAREEGYVRGRQDIIQRIDNLFGSQLSGYEWNNLLAELGQSLRESKK